MKRVAGKIPTILFNASVVLSGFRSPNGGSGILLQLVQKQKIQGVISETILHEVLRNAWKTKQSKEYAQNICQHLFSPIRSAPDASLVRTYTNIVSDTNDAHLLATYQEAKCDYLVSLDKHHVLPLQGKIKGVTIITPGDLLKLLKK